MKIRIQCFTAFLYGLMVVHPAAAQSYPSKAVRFIVGYEAGGVTDQITRVMGQLVGESMGQPFVTENRPGGSSTIAMQACARAPADGHTICFGSGDAMSYNPNLFTQLPYDPEADFTPVVNLCSANNVLVVSMNGPVSISDLVARSRVNPGSINWGTWGAASLPDVYMRWISHQAGVNIVGIPYKGATPIIAAMLQGEVHMTLTAAGASIPNVKAGKLRMIATLGTKRVPIMPDVPTLLEEGFDPGLRTYFGVFAPARTPRPIVDRLNAEFNKALQTQRSQDFMKTWVLDTVGGPIEPFAEFVRQDRANAARVFKAIGVKPSATPL